MKIVSVILICFFAALQSCNPMVGNSNDNRYSDSLRSDSSKRVASFKNVNLNSRFPFLVEIKGYNTSLDTVLNDVKTKKEICRIVDFQEIQYSNVESIEYIKKFEIENLGLSNLYKIKLSDSLPESVRKIFYILLKDKTLFVIPLSEIKDIKYRDNKSLLAGTFASRTKSFLFIYMYVGNSFFLSFNSMYPNDEKKLQFPISIFSKSCIRYKNDSLLIENIDLNKDGLLDILCTGTVENYCSGLEENTDRVQPISSEKVHISLMANHSLNGISWSISDSGYISLLR